MADTGRFFLSGGIIIPPEKRKTDELKLTFASHFVREIINLIKKINPASEIRSKDIDIAVISNAMIHFDLQVTIKDRECYDQIKNELQKVFNKPINKALFYYLTIYDWDNIKNDLILPR